MELHSTYRFQGWNIRYNLAKSNDTSKSQSKNAKCVVFVHGTPWSSAVFKPIIDALLAKGSYRILFYDLPGYGQSQEYDPSGSAASSTGEFEGDTSVKFQAEAITALLKHVQLDGQEGRTAPAVIAHDIAGTIVLRAHLIHGCDFDSMMLVDTNTVLPWGDGFYKLAREEARTFLKLPPSIFEAVVRAVTRSACHNPKVLQAGWEDIIAAPWLDPDSNGATAKGERQRSFVRQIAQANDADVAEMLDAEMYKSVRCDVKIVWGEQDRWIPKHKIEDLIGKLDGRVKECAFIPDAGHLVMLDAPARFALEVFDWLNRYGSERNLALS